LNAGIADSIAASISSSGPYFRLANSTRHGAGRPRLFPAIIEKYQNAFHQYDLPQRRDSYRRGEADLHEDFPRRLFMPAGH
jgi:hypothetical protein